MCRICKKKGQYENKGGRQNIQAICFLNIKSPRTRRTSEDKLAIPYIIYVLYHTLGRISMTYFFACFFVKQAINLPGHIDEDKVRTKTDKIKNEKPVDNFRIQWYSNHSRLQVSFKLVSIGCKLIASF